MKEVEEFNRRAAQILSRARNGSEAVRKVYELRKGFAKNSSIAFVARNSGFGSRANLHNVLSGRRSLSAEGAKLLGAYFGLDLFNLKLLVALARLEGKATKAQKERARGQVSLLKRLLRQNRYGLSGGISPEDYVFFTLVKTSFDLIGGDVSMPELLSLFGKMQEKRISRVLLWGIKEGLIQEAAGRYRYRYRFNATSYANPGKVKLVLRETLLEAGKRIEGLDLHSKEKYFRAGFMSVNRKLYLKHLPKLILAVREFEASIDSPDSDLVVQLGVHVLPVLEKPKAR